MRRFFNGARVLACLPAAALAWGQAAPAGLPKSADSKLAARVQQANRLTWGATPALVGSDEMPPWLAITGNAPLPPAPLPAAAQAQIDALHISREPMASIVMAMDAQRRANAQITDPAQKDAAQKAWQQAMNDLSQQAQTRSILRDLYSPAQMQEQLTWFWFNHFNVAAGKREIRAMVGDYEEGLRTRALGHFRDLLGFTAHHPAMLQYLDNDQNAAHRINENYAREIMELHSMGVGSGYTQGDVQELARILTGVGVRLQPDAPRLKPEFQRDYLRQGLFEFNPARHDYGDKHFMGHTIRGSGIIEMEEALDIIAASPATATHVSRQLARYMLGSDPSPELVARMAATWHASKGRIADVLRTLLQSEEYRASLGHGFKDPVHYAISAVRYAYGDQVVLNPMQIARWLGRMGEPLYGHDTPDGYPLGSDAWAGPGQMATRFDIAREIGGGSAGLFRTAGAATDQPGYPQVQNALWFAAPGALASPQTQTVLAQATSQQEWNMLFLASPDFMRR